MSDVDKSDSSESSSRPGKLRMLWHPLLVRMLGYTLGSAYTVREEVSVEKMPLRVDILLIRRESGELAASRAAEIAALLPLLNRFTLIEFKGPTDVMERGDFAQLVGCSFLWHSQESDPIPHEEVSLVVLAPTFSNALREELRILGLGSTLKDPGIHRIDGLPFTTWIVETDAMAEHGQPVLSLVSRVFLKRGNSIIRGLAAAGHGRLASYAAQYVAQAHQSGDFAMQFPQAEVVDEIEEEVMQDLIRMASVKTRVYGLTLEERLSGLPAEERLRGLSPEERLAGLSEEEINRLRELLERKQSR